MRQHVTVINKQLELALVSAAAAPGGFQRLSQGCGSASSVIAGGEDGVGGGGDASQGPLSLQRGWLWFVVCTPLEVWGLLLISIR